MTSVVGGGVAFFRLQNISNTYLSESVICMLKR